MTSKWINYSWKSFRIVIMKYNVIYKKYFIIYDRVLYLIQIKSKHCCWQKMKKLRISTENREREKREREREKKMITRVMECESVAEKRIIMEKIYCV